MAVALLVEEAAAVDDLRCPEDDPRYCGHRAQVVDAAAATLRARMRGVRGRYVWVRVWGAHGGGGGRGV